MAEADILENKVAKSGIETIDLGDYYPVEPLKALDIKDWLFHGLILKEKDFRQYLDQHDWAQYQGTLVAVFCSVDAVIPLWAYMLIASRLQPFAADMAFGNEEALLGIIFERRLMEGLHPQDYSGKRVVIKGCGDKTVPTHAYMRVTALLKPHVLSIMYGEPCSTVPVYKRPK